MRLLRAASAGAFRAGTAKHFSTHTHSIHTARALKAAQPDQVVSGEKHEVVVGYTEVPTKGKLRLDAYLAARLPSASRARLQSSITGGNVLVNGKPQAKASSAVRAGDRITCTLPPLPPLQAEPEDIPLDIVYEDKHVLVINKPAGMVVHPSPGHSHGTLVNALLHHCGLPPLSIALGSQHTSSGTEETQLEEEDGDTYEDEEEDTPDVTFLPAPVSGTGAAAVIRPGIVHRLDKGTSGLLVVAKNEQTHQHLCDQFKARTVDRIYWSITLGVPKSREGEIQTNIGRCSSDRKRMAAYAYGSSRGRIAQSRYRVLEPLLRERAALVEWKLQTGRTHQIRVHAKHLGHPLLCDETYGASLGMSAAALAHKQPSKLDAARKLVAQFDRPALHALTLGFEHPATGRRLQFASEPAKDFMATLEALRQPMLPSEE